MFIIEKPYVSEYLIDTIINHDWAVLDNDAIEASGMEEGAFRLWESEKATNNYLMQEYPLIYSNSENAIEWVLKNLPKSNLSNYIRIFKDKLVFRDKMKELYPNFYYKSFSYEDINYIDKNEFKFPLVIKPAVGFLSCGVHVIKNAKDWDDEIKKLHKEMSGIGNSFMTSVVDTSTFIAEEYIEGEEYAVDAYYDRNGTPVILNIFKHLFSDESDVRDRLYITSAPILIKNMAKFAQVLRELGRVTGVRNFPLHMEVRITSEGEIIPIEVNPMRFAGWCTTDIAHYAWGINVYECFNAQTYPDWNLILENASKDIYYFAMLEVPSNYPKSSIRSFDFNACLSGLSNVLELRHVNYRENPLFGIVFGKTTDESELQRILALDMNKYIQ